MTSVSPLVLTLLNNATRIANSDGTASPAFIQTTNNAFANILVSFNALAANESDLSALVQQIVTLNNLVTSVNDKVTAADAASSLANSYTDPTSVLMATSTGTTGTITIANHTRVYGDGTKVGVTGATISGLAAGSSYYVYYHDAKRAGGAVSYLTSTNASDAAQVSDVHCVGAATISSTTDSGSSGTGNGGPGVPSISYEKREQLQ